jgi:hypothetical protein
MIKVSLCGAQNLVLSVRRFHLENTGLALMKFHMNILPLEKIELPKFNNNMADTKT